MYIYAETAFHHEGDKDYLLRLVDEAKKSGVDGVKFQVLIKLDDFMSKRHSAYTDAMTWVLSRAEWKDVFDYTQKLGLDIIFMPLDVQAFTLLSDVSVKYIEIHSVSFKDVDLLLEFENHKIPLILGLGGRTRDEIEGMIKRFSDRQIILMVGFQSFPSQLVDINIGKIRELKLLYRNCVIGYADHCAFDDPMAVFSNEYAYLLGARVFEKHITTNEGCERIDFQSAVSSTKIKKIRDNLLFLEELNIEAANKTFVMNDKEVVYRTRQKAPVAIKDLQAGDKIRNEDFRLKMIDSEGKLSDLLPLLGKTLKNGVLAGSAILQGDV
jgi:N,N'-diacetyllegionaminate synthase